MQMLARLAASLLIALTALSGRISSPAAAQSPAYTVIDLGSFAASGDTTADCADAYAGRVSSINAEGVVTGQTAWGEKTGTAFRATDGTVKRLKGGKGGAAGLDINADGQVAGYVVDALDGDPCDPRVQEAVVRRPAVWVGGELQVVPNGDDGYGETRAINDDGILVGFVIEATEVFDSATGGTKSGFDGGDSRPVAWRGDSMEELPLPDGWASGSAVDINAGGQIIGWVYTEDRSQIASVLWDGDEATLLPEGFRAGAINDDGVIVGTTDDDNGAARLVDGELAPLAIPEDATSVFVSGINAAGDVLGLVRTEAGSTTGLWRGDEMIDIATLLPADIAFVSLTPMDLNDSGMLLLNVTTEDGVPHGVVLVPEEG